MACKRRHSDTESLGDSKRRESDIICVDEDDAELCISPNTRTDASVGKDGLQQACSRCTLLNDVSSIACAACGFPLDVDRLYEEEVEFVSESCIGKESYKDIDAALAKCLQEDEDQLSRCKARVDGDVDNPCILPKTLLRIDIQMPAQSLNGLNEAAIDAVLRQRESETALHDGLFDIQKLCFRAMIEREQYFASSHVVFYHSYSWAALLYEVQAVIAQALYPNLKDALPPLSRLLKGPFLEQGGMKKLMRDVASNKFNDHNATYRSLAISSSLSLFSSHSEAPPTQCFNHGYSCNDLSFRNILSKLLHHLGGTEATAVVDRLVDIGSCFGLAVDPYRNKKQDGKADKKLIGHMLQIFVRKDIVADIAYHSQPYGVPAGEPDVLKHISIVPVGGQARICMDPDIFTDSSLSQCFHYCSWPEFCSDETSGVAGRTRGAMRVEIRDALRCMLGTEQSRHRARKQVGLKWKL